MVFNRGDDQLDDDMFYMKWESHAEQRINEKTKIPITGRLTTKKKIPCNAEEAIKLFEGEFEKFLAHIFRIFHQKTALKNLVSNLLDEEIVVLRDFSENYSCKYSTIVQSQISKISYNFGEV